MSIPTNPETGQPTPPPQNPPKKSFSLQEAALAYAICAERLVINDPHVLNTHYGTVPVLVHLLYQSLEISLKHIGHRFHLLNGKDSEGRRLHHSHDVESLAKAIQAGFPGYDFMTILSAAVTDDSINLNFIGRMLLSDELKDTRTAYQNRTLGYAELDSFPIFASYILEWVKAVKDTAENLENCIEALKIIRIKPKKPR